MAVLSDLHSGAFDPAQWYRELEKGCIEKLDKLPILDAVVITGDLLDRKISMNSEYAKYLLKFMFDLFRICKAKNAKLRVLKGTESHDNNQLDVLTSLYTEDSGVDFKIIETVSTEKLFHNVEVLYIPEEYVKNKDEYYAEYFVKDKYDMVFGHGLIKEALMAAVSQESEVTMDKAPVFNVDELLSICKGPIFFGHIHKRITIKNRFMYVNSFSRWAFGEHEDKGFYLCYYAPENHAFKTEFVVNKLARKFDTIKITNESGMFSKQEADQVKYLLELSDTMDSDFIRFAIHIPENYPSPTLLTRMLNEAFATNKRVKLKIVNTTKTKREKEIEEKINSIMSKYEFVFDRKLSDEEKISKFIKKKSDRNISAERVRFYLYKNIINAN